MTITLIFFAIIAGLLTVLSPCILPILPALLSASASTHLRHRPFWIVLGLISSFTLFGVSFAVFGSFLGLSNAVLRNVALIILGFFSLTLLWPQLWEKFGNELSKLAAKIPGTNILPSQQGRGNALMIGASLGLVWAPCAGPILGIILTLAAVQGAFWQTLILLGSYSLGAAGPMLMIGYGGQRLAKKFLAWGRVGALSHQILGVITLLTVIGLYFNLDTYLLTKLPSRFFITNKLEKSLSGESTPTDEPLLSVLGDMPEFTNVTTWLNSPPLKAEDLRGKVVLIDFWTYSCINCIRTLPTLTGWDAKYKDQGLVIIGVHTPEFKFEENPENIKTALARYGIHYPIAVDNNYGIWTAYDNHYWPAKYLIDAQGKIRKTHFGEGDEDEFETAIQSLLREAKLLKAPIKIGSAKTDVDFNKINSPETYVGYERAANFVSLEAVKQDEAQKYSEPKSYSLNDWALAGTWAITAEAALLKEPHGKIAFRFQAPKLNLVMKGSSEGSLGSVLIDGKPLPANMRGDDVNEQGQVKIQEPKLYNLIKLPPNDTQEHVFELIFEQPNIAVYAFTFG
jgi:cytochrome c biogenesis protein CcdA/thiol-disulfide isomerase/thioredoxin